MGNPSFDESLNATEPEALDVLLARQSILKADHSLFGFEVLYRGKNYQPTNPEDGAGATGELLNNLCTFVIDERLASGQPLFINVDEKFIESPNFFPSKSDKIVLELLETVPATPSILQKVRELRRQGFEFALDDFIFEEERMAFLPLVSVVKVDVLACPLERIEQALPTLKKLPITLLAEKVEDFDTFLKCQELGFELFQGYYLERPKLVRGVKISTSKQVTLKLLSELTRPDITVTEVSDLIACDPRLAVKIVLLVNSSLFSFVRKISDVREAVVVLGLEAVKRWAMILLLVSDSTSPIEIFRILLARAKTLEIYSLDQDADKQSDYFTLGLFSGLDAILGVHIETITDSLPIAEEIKNALNSRAGNMGALLTALNHIETQAEEIAPPLEQHFEALNGAYWQGLVWADELMESIVR